MNIVMQRAGAALDSRYAEVDTIDPSISNPA
jgi:hypothetical protein